MQNTEMLMHGRSEAVLSVLQDVVLALQAELASGGGPVGLDVASGDPIDPQVSLLTSYSPSGCAYLHNL